MKFAIQFGAFCLSFRKDIEFEVIRDDPRGLTGSEYGMVRIAEEIQALGHDVSIHTVSPQTDFHGIAIKALTDPVEADIVISINEPDLLRDAPVGAFKVCAYWLNGTSHCRAKFYEHVDLFLSPSAPHLEQMFKRDDWRRVEVTQEHPNGKERYEPDASNWVALPLGCDPERYKLTCDLCHGHGYENGLICEQCGNDGIVAPQKIPGRVIYSSSPDRGLHWLLQEWPAIKRAVPHATLHIFYRLEPWLRDFDGTPFFPPIEPLRARANYVEECLRRFAEHGGMGVTLRDSVSRRTIEREMAQAEVLAYPANTTTWSEGFSCTVLEACAARACPVITSCDALGEVYADIGPVPMAPGWVEHWRDRVIAMLLSEAERAGINDRAAALASKLTWKNYVANLLKEIENRWPQKSTPEHPSNSPSAPVAESS